MANLNALQTAAQAITVLELSAQLLGAINAPPKAQTSLGSDHRPQSTNEIFEESTTAAEALARARSKLLQLAANEIEELQGRPLALLAEKCSSVTETLLVIFGRAVVADTPNTLPELDVKWDHPSQREDLSSILSELRTELTGWLREVMRWAAFV